MTPFFFGSGARRLFGVYEPAVAGRRAAVLCHPWGPEYLYAHRTMRQLAVRLSAAGFHTLRFDYFGTGDSAGEMEDADLAGWEADIALAIEELRDIAGAARVVLIGLRLGATLAARVAAARPTEIDSLVLWDPIFAGGDYLRSLDGGDGRVATVRGFPLTATMRCELNTIALDPLLAAAPTRTLLLGTEQPALSRQAPATTPPRLSKAAIEVETLTAVRPWIEDPLDMGVVPVGVIQRIVEWLG